MQNPHSLAFAVAPIIFPGAGLQLSWMILPFGGFSPVIVNVLSNDMALVNGSIPIFVAHDQLFLDSSPLLMLTYINNS